MHKTEAILPVSRIVTWLVISYVQKMWKFPQILKKG